MYGDLKLSMYYARPYKNLGEGTVVIVQNLVSGQSLACVDDAVCCLSSAFRSTVQSVSVTFYAII